MMAKWPRALSKTALRSLRVFNTHGMLARGEPTISYVRDDLGDAGWRATVKGVTIPGPWYELGGKTFIVMSRTDKDSALLLAQRYVEENHDPVTDGWVRNPYGDWVPYRVVDRLVERLAAKKASMDAA